MRVLGFRVEKMVKELGLLATIVLGILSIIIMVLFLMNSHFHVVDAASLDDYESRKERLKEEANQPFVDDPMRNVETALDKESFEDINELDCPKPIDNSDGWSVIMRTGGRPFMNFDSIEINGSEWTLERCVKGGSDIPQHIIDEHYDAGKGVNRMWFIHPSQNGYPIVLVMTPDGFFNVGGSSSPKLQGAAARIGFIGEPFGDNDFQQHVDEVNISVVDDDTLLIIYNIHSEAGEGVMELELKWDSTNESPELNFRSAHVIRTDFEHEATEFGFAGFNFMKGPTLSGKKSQSGTPEGGIEAFHDGRTLFLVHANGSISRNLLISPILTDTIVREEIANNIISSSKIVLDQPQDIENYFSKFPVPSYDERADLILKLVASSVDSVNLIRAQKSVDLSDINPEANETVNVFYSAEMSQGELYEFSYQLLVAAEDFERQYTARHQGIVFVSDRLEDWSRLYFLALDNNFSPIGLPIPLTDVTISDPHNLGASADGKFIVFDADESEGSDHRRIYSLDLLSGAVRRLTVDPYGDSRDERPSLSGDGSQFSMITNRHGTSNFTIEDVKRGVGGGNGNEIGAASYANWCHVRNEIVYSKSNGLFIYDVEGENHTTILSMTGIQKPRFSPNCEKITYRRSSGIWIVDSDGSNYEQVVENADHPAWIDEDHLLFQRTHNGNTDIYLLTISSLEIERLITNMAVDSEPVFVRAIEPSISIESPTDGFVVQLCHRVQLSGYITSAGIPSVTVNGRPAIIEGDRWKIAMYPNLNINSIVAEVTDSGTGLTSKDEIKIEVFEPCNIYLPALLKGG